MKKRVWRDKDVRALALRISSAILELPKPASNQDVIRVFEEAEAPPHVLCDAFWKLDNCPSHWPSYMIWHPPLRALRNDPHDAPKLFALFRLK
ncbi:hypothetical protein [Hydrogenophaga sp. NFH-34]|uniref:hypothetical protein n=1 Tax=Hydrogenophaga sp. NFH-34 TaxID=2744446 RepID=UPI001F242977|nr:hypothetical protein [Hydrogenophaga sp. NFH-34]